ncbi:MAG: hydrogenase iron-sulfur subunit [Candidatus Solibacter sp.]|nr:hydrogenase iron-sulfur subunit [Candidatus Solibacter sp.]
MIQTQTQPDAPPLGKPFEPRIVGFLCNWCSYAGADKAGAAQMSYPPNIRIVRVMCSGRVDAQFVLQAYRDGADGVLILACHAGDCHYLEGNYRATQRHRVLVQLSAQFGIEEARCRFDYVSAGEGEKFVRVVSETVEAVRALGPLTHPSEAGG